MQPIKQAADLFLANKRVAVTGVSREAGSHGGNIVYQRLRERGYDVFAVNPNAEEVEVRVGPVALGVAGWEVDVDSPGLIKQFGTQLVGRADPDRGDGRRSGLGRRDGTEREHRD